MQRDGSSKSLWQDTTNSLKQSQTSSGFRYDVIIAGGGITGITTALQLQKKGKSVLIAEAHNLGFGTTGGTTAHLNSFLDTSYPVIQKKFGKNEAILVANALKASLSLIENNVKEYNIECGYRKLPGYLFSQNKEQTDELEEMAAAARECQVKCDWTDQLPLPVPFDKILMFEEQASFHPGRYIMALADAFRNAGGTILEHCRVTGIDEIESGVRVQANSIEFHCSHFVYATHIPPGVNLLHFRCAPYRSYAMAAKIKDATTYEDALVYDMYDPYHYYRWQNIDGELYFIAGGEDHKTGHEENTEQCFRKLEAHVSTYFPVEQITNKWSSQYFEPTDGLAYIGELPGHSENVLVATGFSGNGMVYSGVAGILLTDLILNQENEWIDLFNPNRIKMIAGFSNFVKESADVVGLLTKKIMVPSKKISELASLAPGEAAIVKYEGKKLALYKDEAGEIFAVEAACTHIKCDVSWNNAEKTWDCPCHGSRFSYTGEMLTAPARRDLPAVEINREV